MPTVLGSMDASSDKRAPDDTQKWTQAQAVAIADGARTTTIDWADGHQSVYPWWYLRGMCPCAVCQGHGGDHRFVSQGTDSALKDIFEVGHYALNITWSDNHKTGIYSFVTLRLLCPCVSCRTALGAQHACAQEEVRRRFDEVDH